MTRQIYPTDISREDFDKVRGLIEGNRKQTRPRIHDLYDVVCGMLYVLGNQKKWREMPEDFPPWRTIHEYFIIWKRSPLDGNGSLLKQIMMILGKEKEYQFSLTMRRGYAQDGIGRKKKPQ